MNYISPEVRQQIRAGAQRSAISLGSFLASELGIKEASILDVGCGEGFLTEYFRSQGCEAYGVDGDNLPGVDEVIDLTQPLGFVGYDFTFCLEVGEHLPDSAAETLVDSLCSAAPVVVFSAAIPFQGGPGHINEQWPDYWVEKFARRGFGGTGALRYKIWGDQSIEPWYRQNLLVFGSELPEDECLPLVHPEIWTHHRQIGGR